MAQPNDYDPGTEFTGFELAQPQFPGQELDVEFANLKITTDEILANLELIQRDDGALANESVGYDQLSTEVRALIGDDAALAVIQAMADSATASASAAATSASTASTAASTATTALDSFDDRYLGAKASDPTLDNDGDALLTGALYWNTALDALKVYDGAAWQSYSPASGAPADVDYLVKTASASLSAERVVTDVSAAGGVEWDWGTSGQAKAKLHVSAADKFLVSSGADAWSEADITAAGLELLNDANAAAMRTTLGLGALATLDAVPDNSVSNARLADMAQATVKLRRVTAGSGDPVDGSAGDLIDILASKCWWFDDFIGDSLDGRYTTSLLGDAVVKNRATGVEAVSSTGPFGGWLLLFAPNTTVASPSTGQSTARIRLGSDPPDDGLSEQWLPFNAAKNPVGETRVFISDTGAGNFMATIGFTAYEDPDNILGVLFYNASGWFLQTAKNGSTTNVAIPGFAPSASQIFKVRIEASTTLVVLYINNVEAARSTTNIPDTVGACWEFQLWNQDNGGWTSLEMAADYLAIHQNR